LGGSRPGENAGLDWGPGHHQDPLQLACAGRPSRLASGPQRQFVLIISGRLEIGFEDGSKKVFGPGDARLVEDTTGKGHTTIALGDEPCITATIGLKDQS
jgi:hypothetical protein